MENPNKSSEEVGTDILSQSPHLMHDQRKQFMKKTTEKQQQQIPGVVLEVTTKRSPINQKLE